MSVSCKRLCGKASVAIVMLSLIPRFAVAQTVGCSLRAGAAESQCAEISKTLGDPYNDTGYAHEIFNLSRAFSVQPGFFVCRENGAPNAFATPETVELGTIGSVFLGMSLAQSELRRSGQYNNFTLPAILAHEVGHIVQFRERNRLTTKLKELQADYLAGWYMANRDRGVARWSETSVQQNMSTFYGLGDYDYNNQDHHGTPDERLAAVLAGFRSATLSLPAVYKASYQYVSSQSYEPNTGPGDGSQAGGSLSGQDAEATVKRCLNKRIASCMDDCTNNYGFSRSRCSNQMCSPDSGSNQSWERVCRAAVKE